MAGVLLADEEGMAAESAEGALLTFVFIILGAFAARRIYYCMHRGMRLGVVESTNNASVYVGGAICIAYVF